MKKLLPLLLGLLLALTCAGFAEGEATKPENYDGVYTCILLDDGSVEIVEYSGSAEDLEVPAELGGHTVSSIGDGAFSWHSDLISVTLPDSLTSIGKNAFSDCGSLTLTVPRDSYAKQYCDENGLRYIYPDSNDWLND